MASTEAAQASVPVPLKRARPERMGPAKARDEFALSERSLALVEGMGRLLGTRDSTGPDDDPMLRSLRAESRAEGEVKGRTESRARMAREMLLARGIKLSEGFLADPSTIAELPESAIATAALACDSERDFLLRLGCRQS